MPVEPNVPPNDGWLPGSQLDTTPQSSKFLFRCFADQSQTSRLLIPR
jgi:hypothetical protein